MNIYLFYKRERQFRQLMSSVGLNRNRYIRIMAISATEILVVIPLGALKVAEFAKFAEFAKLTTIPWRSWAYTHKHLKVDHFPALFWKDVPYAVGNLETYRWSFVLCAFLFFALFGFADEARINYRRLYTSIAGRIGYSASALHRSSDVYVVRSIYGCSETHNVLQYSICSLRKDGWREAGFQYLTHRRVFDPVHFHCQ
jgi:pheromone a factor receptor